MRRMQRMFVLFLITLILTGLVIAAGILSWHKPVQSFLGPPLALVKSNWSVKETPFEPSAFLEFLQPKNVSYCDFPYGGIEDWTLRDEDISYTPELGDKSPYRVIYNVVTPPSAANFQQNLTQTITYATHATVDLLYLIAELTHKWDGLLSVAIFVPGPDIIIALTHLRNLCFCLPSMQNVSVHFIYPANNPPNITSGQESNISNCWLKRIRRNDTFRGSIGLTYPVNVARNVARAGARTKYLLVADIELFPSRRLVPEFFRMLARLVDKEKHAGEFFFTKKKHVFVVPVFEVASNVTDLPSTKRELIDLYRKDKVVYFHKHICQHCQRFPGLLQWLQRKYPPHMKPSSVEPMLIVRREFPHHRWEPIYIGTNREPWYSELLSWEGKQDKMTQMYEMCLMDYRFVILDGAFLVHSPGIKKKPAVSSTATSNKKVTVNTPRSAHVKRNTYLYSIITHDIASKYGQNHLCKPF